MYYDRVQIKLAAKAIIRDTKPKPMWITLAYMMLVSLSSLAVSISAMLPSFLLAGARLSGQMDFDGALAPLSGLSLLFFFVTVLLVLYSMVMEFGFSSYVIKVKRGQPSGLRDLFSGFSKVGRILMLNLLIVLFTVLWSLLGVVGLMILILIPALLQNFVLTTLFSIVGYFAFLAFLYNRILRYTPAVLIMVDHPELTASECLNESKAIMRGNICKFIVLQLSFIGWNLLIVAVAYAIILPGMFLCGFLLHPEAAIVPFILICVVAFLVASIFSMWISAYQSVAFVGFYDAINGFDCPTTPPDHTPASLPTMIPPQFASPESQAPVNPESQPEPTAPQVPQEDIDNPSDQEPHEL